MGILSSAVLRSCTQGDVIPDGLVDQIMDRYTDFKGQPALALRVPDIRLRVSRIGGEVLAPVFPRYGSDRRVINRRSCAHECTGSSLDTDMPAYGRPLPAYALSRPIVHSSHSMRRLGLLHHPPGVCQE